MDRKLPHMVFVNLEDSGKTKHPCAISKTDENRAKSICERCGIACYVGAYSGLFLFDMEWLRMFKVAKIVCRSKTTNFLGLSDKASFGL